MTWASSYHPRHRRPEEPPRLPPRILRTMIRFRRSVALKALLTLALLAVAVRAALPWAVEYGINRALSKNQSIDGHVADVNLQLLKGGYQLRDLTLARREPPQSQPFFTAKLADFSIDWRSLVKRRLLMKGRLVQPMVDIDAFPKKGQQEQAKEEADEVADTVMPVKISRLEVKDGVLRVPTGDSSPVGPRELREVAGKATDIRVTDDPRNRTETKVSATAIVPGDGRLAIELTFDPFASPIRFDLDASLERVKLPLLNPVIRKAVGMDVQSGTGAVYAEARAAGGRFAGYVKPLLKDVNVLDAEKEKATLGEKIKEGVADAVKEILENEKQNSVGARVPFAGRFDDPSIGVWRGALTVLRHAFVQALTPTVEGRI